MQMWRPLRVALVGFSRSSRTLHQLETALRSQRARVTRLRGDDCSTLNPETDCVFISAHFARRAGKLLDQWRNESRALWMAVDETDVVPSVDQQTGLLTWGVRGPVASRSVATGSERGLVLRFHTLVLDCQAHELEAHGRIYQLSPEEASLMELLMERAGQIVAVEDIVRKCAGSGSEKSPQVSALVGRLRRRVEADPRAPRWIRTYRGRGYRLVGPLPPMTYEEDL